MHWKILDLSLGGNWGKSLWHFLSGGLESNWDTKCLPDCQSLPSTTALHNSIQVDTKSVFYNQQTLFCAEGLKSNLLKSTCTKDDCMCFRVCLVCFVNILLSVNSWHQPRGDLCLIDLSRVFPTFAKHAQWVRMMYGWAVYYKAPLLYKEHDFASLHLGAGREGLKWRTRLWVLWKAGIKTHESCSKYREPNVWMNRALNN